MNYKLISQKSFQGTTGYGSDADTMVKDAVVAGIKFLEENPSITPDRGVERRAGGAKIFPLVFDENADMEKLRKVISPLMYGGSGAMYEQAVSIVMFWKKYGTEETLLKLR